MKKQWLLGVLIITIFCTPIHYYSYQDFTYVYRENIFDEKFTEPFESLYIVLYNGTEFRFTLKHVSKVVLPLDYLIRQLKKDNKDIKDVAIIIHNHFRSPRFSLQDKVMLYQLRDMGYEGSFCIYFTPTGKIIEHKGRR